jgi:hypothetical protein
MPVIADLPEYSRRSLRRSVHMKLCASTNLLAQEDLRDEENTNK